MPVTRKEDQATDDHHIGEHANTRKEYCRSDMKDQYKKVSNRSCAFIQQEKNNEEIICCTKPGKQVSNPFLIHELTNNRYITPGWQPDLHRLGFNHPIVIQFCQSCE